MPRGPRVDAPGCVQHVMLRGIEKRRIFRDDADRRDFLMRSARIVSEVGARCYGFALMPNHVHLILRTGRTPLARLMARLGTGYAQGFNRRHDRVGHLFQNRYQSIRVEDDAQLLALVRYVHRNPLRAGLIASLSALLRYPWTGHQTLMGYAADPLVDSRRVLEFFGGSRLEARKRLALWMEDSTGPRPISDSRSCGPPATVSHRDPAADIARDDTAELARLVHSVCMAAGILETDLRTGLRNRAVSRVRAELVYRASVELGISGAVIACALGISEGAVTRARRRGQVLSSRRSCPPGKK